jgi:hypothetical protein
VHRARRHRRTGTAPARRGPWSGYWHARTRSPACPSRVARRCVSAGHLRVIPSEQTSVVP